MRVAPIDFRVDDDMCPRLASFGCQGHQLFLKMISKTMSKIRPAHRAKCQWGGWRHPATAGWGWGHDAEAEWLVQSLPRPTAKADTWLP